MMTIPISLMCCLIVSLFFKLNLKNLNFDAFSVTMVHAMLGAASHGPAHRRPGQDGRFPTHRGKGRVRQPPWRRSSPFQGQHCSPPWGKGLEKVT